MSDVKPCPICEEQVPANPRCAGRAVDEHGRALTFFNQGLSGGFQARVNETGEWRDDPTCYVGGVQCRAEEGRFGGIVVEVTE
jgi:hypothetical protein